MAGLTFDDLIPAAPGAAPAASAGGMFDDLIPAPKPAVPPPPLGGSMGEGQPQLGGPQGDYYIPPVPWLGFPGVAKDIKKGAEALDAGPAPKPEDFGIDPRSPDYAQNSGPDTPYGKARADWLARVTSGMLGGEGVQWVTGQPSGIGTGMRWSGLPKDLPPSPEGPGTPPGPPAGGAPQQQLPAPRAAAPPTPDPWELPPGALAGYGGGPAARASDLAGGPAPQQEQQKPIVPPKPPRPGATPAEVVEQGAVDAGLERSVAPQEPPPPPPAVAQPPAARAPAPPVGPGEEGVGGPPAKIPHETPAEQPVEAPPPALSPHLNAQSEIDPASLGIVPAGDGYVPATPEAIARVDSQLQVADMARPKRAPPAKGPQSLLAWLQARGGVADPEGELAKMDAQLWRRNKSDKVGFVTPEGEHPDYAREAAEEAGYLPQGATLPDLYAHIDRELRGRPVYTEEGQAQADAADARRQMLDEIDRMGGGDARRWSADKINAFYQKHAQQAAEAQEAMEGRLDRDAQDLIEMVEDERLRHEIEGLGWSSEGLASPDEDLFSVAGRPAEAAPARTPGAEGAARPQAGGQAPQARPTVDTVTSVVGATQQHVIPGAERITDRELAERRMAAPKRAGKAQRDVGDLPLFSDEKKQGSLFEPGDTFKEAYRGQLANMAEDLALASGYARQPVSQAKRNEKAAFLYGAQDGITGDDRTSMFNGERQEMRDAYRKGLAKGRASKGQALFQPPGDIKKPPAPTYLYPAPAPPRDVTLDYDYFRRQANVSGPTAAKAYVLDRGRKDGNEHMVALWPDGSAIEAVTSGQPSFVAFGPRTALMIMAPGTRAVLHHNHPSGRSLSGGDVSALGMRGVDTIWAHVDTRLHGIEGYGARLADGMRQWLGDGAAPGRLLEMNGLVRDVISDHLIPLVETGQIDRVAANLLGPHLVNRAISEAGVMDYWYDPLLDRGVAAHEAFGEALAAATRDLHMALNTLEVHNGPRPARDLGGAGDVRPAGNVAGVPAGPGAAGAGGPGQEGSAPVGRQLYRQNPPARRRQPKVDPRQLKLLEAGDLREDEPFFDDGDDGEPPRLLPPPGGGAAGGRGPLAAARRVWDTIKQSDFIDNLMMHMAPSGAPSASDQARAMEKRWADADRVSTMALIHYDATLRKLLPNVADRQFLDAMDEQGVMVQRGEIQLGEVRQGYGWGRLNPTQLSVAKQLDAYGEALGRAAVELGIFQGTLPHWTPRMLMRMASGSDIGSSGRVRARALDQLGVNMRASSPHFMKRKHLTRAETEAAAQLKLGPEAMLVNDVRGMLLAIHGIERAIATRKLINAIKEIGRATGQDTVTTGPRGPGHDFTIPNHPAFLEWRPVLQQNPDGTFTQAVNPRTGEKAFERHALYIRKDFEGPLRAIMQPRPGSMYRGLMQAKSTATTMIMFSPLIHNGVIWGKALEAMPGKAATFQLYYRGASVKRDHGRMRQLVSRGMAPITGVGPVQDIQQDVMGGGPQILPGRGLLAKGLRRAIGAIRPEAGDAAARGIDAAGDLWHKKMLWDWVANLQAGMADAMSEHLMRRYPGMARETADTVAGHFANRIAGALPAEAMGRWSRAIANIVLFSRSFNVTTLGTFKDAFGPRWSQGDFRGFGGLPQDTAAKLEEDMGTIQRAMGDSATRRLAQLTILRGILFTIAGYSLLNDALNAILGDSIPQLIRDYATRFRDMLSRVKENPLELLNPFGLLESLSSTYWNEPGKQNRVDLGGKPDEQHLYLRIPPGKIGEDFMALAKGMTGNFPALLDLLKRKEGTLFKPIMQVLANADDFGRPIYNASDKSMEGVLKATGNMALTLLGAQVPLVNLKGVVDLATGAPNAGRNAIKALAPLGGVTLSVGDPGGPAAGQVHAVGRDIESRWKEALPSIRDQIRRGDAEGASAMARMLALGMDPRLARYYLNSTRVPSRISGRAMQQFMRGASREQQEKLRILQGEP